MNKKILLLCTLGCWALISYSQAQITASAKVGDKLTNRGAKIIPAAMFPKSGEWPCMRRTGTLEAFSPLSGNFTKPSIVWKQFVGAIESLIVVEPGERNTELSLPGDELKAPAPADSINMADYMPLPRSAEEDNNMSSVSTTYVDILPEYPGKEKIEFESAFAKPMINGEWAYCV